MFEKGHLFAWHLYLESFGIAEFLDLKEKYGEPDAYGTAMADIAGLFEILEEVQLQVGSAPCNSVFEMGILYVCARNIAMSASWHLGARPDFGRYSPFALPNLPFPLSKEQYDVTMRCRMASTRGTAPAEVTPQAVVDAATMLLPWSASVSALVRLAQ
jgi:hypothetical protein